MTWTYGGWYFSATLSSLWQAIWEVHSAHSRGTWLGKAAGYYCGEHQMHRALLHTLIVPSPLAEYWAVVHTRPRSNTSRNSLLDAISYHSPRSAAVAHNGAVGWQMWSIGGGNGASMSVNGEARGTGRMAPILWERAKQKGSSCCAGLWLGGAVFRWAERQTKHVSRFSDLAHDNGVLGVRGRGGTSGVHTCCQIQRVVGWDRGARGQRRRGGTTSHDQQCKHETKVAHDAVAVRHL